MREKHYHSNKWEKWPIGGGITYCIRNEEVVSQQSVVQQGGNDALQAHQAPVGLQGGHPHKQRLVARPETQTDLKSGIRMFWNKKQIDGKNLKMSTDAWERYRVPAVTMVESPILVARSASRLTYLSPPRSCGARRVRSSNTLPSPPSSMMYSIPSRACREPTLSRNQLTAPGLVMFSFTQNFPRHWLITGTWWEEETRFWSVCKRPSPAIDFLDQAKFISYFTRNSLPITTTTTRLSPLQDDECAAVGSHQFSLMGRGEAEPVGLCAVHEGGVELRGVHAQERGQGDGNVKKLDKREVSGQSLGHPPFPDVEVVMVLQGDTVRNINIAYWEAALHKH